MTTAINTIQESQLVLPFGSVYYTSLGTLSTKESPSSVMTLEPMAKELLEKLQAQNVPAEAPKPEADGENQETHKVSLKK